MSEIAAKTLVTSKGTVQAGKPIPELPKKEMENIRDAGGIAKIAAVQPGDAAKVKAYGDAVAELKAAEADVSAAKTDAEKDLADKRLTEARRVLFSV